MTIDDAATMDRRLGEPSRMVVRFVRAVKALYCHALPHCRFMIELLPM